MHHETRNLIEAFPSGQHIGLAHSMVMSSLTKGDEGDYLPSSIETISSKGYLYFGLGHIHQNGSIDKHETIYYSGALQGLNSNETGLKGGNLVTINDGAVDVLFVPLSHVMFDKITVDVTGLESLEKVLDVLQVEIKNYQSSYDVEQMSLELTLIGRTELYRKLQDIHELSELRGLILDRIRLFDLKLKVNVKTHYELSTYMKQNSVLGEVLRLTTSMHRLPDLNYLSEENDLEEIKEGLQEQIMAYFLEGYDEN